MKRFLSRYEKLMRRTAALSLVAACLMILAGVLDLYWVARAFSMTETSLDDLLSHNWKTIFLYATIGAISLIRAYIVLSGSRRSYIQIMLSGVLVFGVTLGFWWVTWPHSHVGVECPPGEGKICFGVYEVARTAWTQIASIVYPIAAVLRSSLTGAYVIMNDEYK